MVSTSAPRTPAICRRRLASALERQDQADLDRIVADPVHHSTLSVLLADPLPWAAQAATAQAGIDIDIDTRARG